MRFFFTLWIPSLLIQLWHLNFAYSYVNYSASPPCQERRRQEGTSPWKVLWGLASPSPSLFNCQWTLANVALSTSSRCLALSVPPAWTFSAPRSETRGVKFRRSFRNLRNFPGWVPLLRWLPSDTSLTSEAAERPVSGYKGTTSLRDMQI